MTAKAHFTAIPEPGPVLTRARPRASHIWDPYQPHRPDSDLVPPRLEESSIRKSALRWFLAAMAIFIVWAFYAPLDQGVSVIGTVAVLGKRKAVQHPRGGVVENILTREGAKVTQGDVLIRINPLNAASELTANELQYINLLATESRLLSERIGRSAIEWIGALEQFHGDRRATEAKELQTQLFRSRQEDMRGQQAILSEQISGLQAQADGLQDLLREVHRQVALLARGAKDTRELADQGYVSRNSADDIERNLSTVTGNVANTNADLAKTRAAIAGARLQLALLKTNLQKDIDTQLSDIQKSREALQAKVESLRFDLNLTDIKAPVSGVVVGLKPNTIGGVINASDVLMEIVPIDQSLIVEAQVPPTVIDKVKIGLEADMRFTAFNLRTTPVIPGRVKLVGPDRLKYEGSQDEYYLAHVEVTPEGKKLLASYSIQPGMPVDVIIKTGERTFIEYVLKPISDRFAKALKEQ